MIVKHLLVFISILISQLTFSQSKKNELAFAEAYTAVRYFFPTNITDVDWRMFNYTNVSNEIFNDSSTVDVFTQVFSAISPLIQFSLIDKIDFDSTQLQNPVYWQHYGFGKKNGVYYKSSLVPIDSISYLYNGLQYFERIQKSFDSVEVILKINQFEALNFSNNFLVYGWKTGKQIITKEELHFNSEKNSYYCRLKEPIEDVYFRYFLEAEYGVNVEIETISIVGYQQGKEEIIIFQDFASPLKDELDLGNHHSVDVQINKAGTLNLKSKDKLAFNQIYKEDLIHKKKYFTTKLANGIYMHFPLVVEKGQVINSISYTEASFSIDDLPVIAKCNLVDVYGHLLHFHPYFDASDEGFKNLFSNLYDSADTCKSLLSVSNHVRRLMFPVKDAHMYLYNGLIPTPKKFVGLAVEFIGKKCVVKNSHIDQIQSGDRIVSFQGLNPWDIYQNNKRIFLGSDNYSDNMAKKYLFVEDTSVQVDIIYKKHISKKKYKGYAEYYSDYNTTENINFELLEDDIYYVNLRALEADTFQYFIQNTPSIKGLILDGREGIKIESKILEMLTGDTLFYPHVYVPIHNQPFKTNIIYDTLNQNSFLIGKSNIDFPVMLMIGPKNFSHEETFIHLAQQIPNLKLAGNNSAGCNGMITNYRGVGGFEVRFTGSIVEKIDNTELYNVGFFPDITTTNKRRDFKHNIDGLLRKCLQEIVILNRKT